MSYQQPDMMPTEFQDIAGVTFDCSRQEITSPLGTTRIRAKLWQVLSYLMQNSEHLVKREDLIELVWLGNYFTGPQGLTHTICHLRQVINLLRLPIKITTFSKQGYVLQMRNKLKEASEIKQKVSYIAEDKSKPEEKTNHNANKVISQFYNKKLGETSCVYEPLGMAKRYNVEKF